MPVTWPTTGRTPGAAMDYFRQMKAFTAFNQLFEFRTDQPKVDSSILRLHSQVTVMLLMVGTMFVSMRQYFGEPIECMAGPSDVPPAMLQHFCWLEATFSVAEADGKAVVGDHVAYPGVKVLDEQRGERRTFHKYYQWVFFVLIIQAIMFYVPKFMWKNKEAKRLHNLIAELKSKHVNQMNDFDKRRLIQDLVDSMLISNTYYGFLLFCEVFCLVHLVVEVWFINIFLGGQFSRLGIDWLYYSNDERPNVQDPLVRVFPRMTKCVFHKYGYSGAIEKHDALCFLPLNIVNEKLYVVLWFWFIFLFGWTVTVLLYRLAINLIPYLRFQNLRSLAPNTQTKYLRRLTSRVGNFFILQTVAYNMKPSHFRDLMDLTAESHFDADCNLILNNSTETMVSQMSQKGQPKGNQETMKKSTKMSNGAPPMKQGFKQPKTKSSMKNNFV